MAKKEVINNDAMTLRVSEGPAETALDILGEASDVIEQTLDVLEDTAERVVTVTRNNPLVLAGVLILGAGIGGFVAYKVAVKRTEARYETIIEEQIAEAKAFYKRVNKADEFETPEKAVKALVPEEVVEAVNSYQGKDKATPYNRPKDIVTEAPVEVVVEETTVVHQNVFVENSNPLDWDMEHELATRDTTQPYVISFEEFNENDEGNEQATLTYYAGDDTLADEKEQMIDNTDYTVGDDNLLRFGHGSNDSKVVYIRNERLGMDFEVIRSKGAFSQEVLGIEPPASNELRHSQRRPNRRHWSADE